MYTVDNALMYHSYIDVHSYENRECVVKSIKLSFMICAIYNL